MTFSIDTGAGSAIDRIPAKSDFIDDGARVSFNGRGEHAERTHRQIIENIWSVDTLAQLRDYYERESIVIDALFLDYPEYAERVMAAYQECRAGMQPELANANARPAQPDIPIAQNGNTTTKGTKMNAFAFDSGSSGSEGPWINWSARGTQDGKIPAKSFYLRDADSKDVFKGFDSGVILDIHNMKTGWQQSDGVIGQAPDWKWNATVATMAPQPGEDYKKGFEIRCAIGGGETATWQQAGAAVWNAFANLVPALQQGPEGKLPLVRVTGTKAVQFKRGSTVEPILEVTKWVDRPDCLKEGFAAGVDIGEDAPQQTTKPAPSTASVPEEATF